MFKQGDLVVYPKYGISKIRSIFTSKASGIERKYYEIKFDNNLLISVPTENAAKLGLRYPLKKKELLESLTKLNKKVSLDQEVHTKLLDVSKEKLSTGLLDDAIELLNIFKGIQKQRRVINKKLEMGEEDAMNYALNFVKSEIVAVLGEDHVEKFKI